PPAPPPPTKTRTPGPRATPAATLFPPRASNHNMSQLKHYTADHRYLLEVVARQAGFAHPVAITFNQLADPLLRASRKGEVLPIDGVLVRDWCPFAAPHYAGVQFGMRFYEVQGVRYVQVQA